MNQYEAMFVFDPTFGNSYEKCETEIRRLLERARGEMIRCGKWDERRLAYRIKGRKRGVYVLAYFKAPPDGIAGLEHDAKLSEDILRLLVVRADHMTREAMEREYPVGSEERPPATGDATEKVVSPTPAQSDKESEGATAPVSQPVAVETTPAEPGEQKDEVAQ